MSKTAEIVNTHFGKKKILYWENYLCETYYILVEKKNNFHH